MLALLNCIALGTPILGHIDLPKDRPPEHLQIRFVQVPDESVTLATSEIDPDGNFRFDLNGLPKSARFKLDSRWLWLPSREQGWGPDGYDMDEPYRLHARLGVSVHGRVVLPSALEGRADLLKGAQVRVAHANGWRAESALGPLRDDGSFAFENLDPDYSYDVRLEQDGFQCIYQRVQGCGPGKIAQVEMDAEPAVRLRGHVFATDGSALAGAHVMFTSSENGPKLIEIWEREFRRLESSGGESDWSGCLAVTGPDGSFAFERAPDITPAVLLVLASGFRSKTMELAELRAGELRSDLEYLLTPHARLEITAVDEHGDPVPRAAIAALDLDSNSAVDLVGASDAPRSPIPGSAGYTTLLDWLEPPLPIADEHGRASLRVCGDVKHILLDVRDGDLVGFPPEPLTLEDGMTIELTVTLKHSAPVCIQFPSKLLVEGGDDLRVFDARGWMRTATIGREFGGPPYPWNAYKRNHPAPNDSLPGIRLAPLPAGRYTVKAVDATGKVHSKTFVLDPLHPASIDLNRE